ncbi:hypothetical protein NRIC_00430 [Enterococcus florum]|uniref:HTH cro/C1-type domain-containing protein n=1 Tax=Enterococcus florum TaxID=2480627 RepID=A0A4P5P9J9_9ENTE|nr:helix-turn-helix transcriptional regulator [Enterococcus florum]GCF92152.1 hypothetical protein NRIC_00430 [Enterococcus florum]
MQLNDLIVQRIKFFRTKQKISQDTLSKRAGLELKYINKIENKKIGITIATLENIIIKGLNISYSEFFDFPKIEDADENHEQAIAKFNDEELKEMLLKFLNFSDEFEDKLKKIKQNLNTKQ